MSKKLTINDIKQKIKRLVMFYNCKSFFMFKYDTKNKVN